MTKPNLVAAPKRTVVADEITADIHAELLTGEITVRHSNDLTRIFHSPTEIVMADIGGAMWKFPLDLPLEELNANWAYINSEESLQLENPNSAVSSNKSLFARLSLRTGKFNYDSLKPPKHEAHETMGHDVINETIVDEILEPQHYIALLSGETTLRHKHGTITAHRYRQWIIFRTIGTETTSRHEWFQMKPSHIGYLWGKYSDAAAYQKYDRREYNAS